jgi:small redox-active disulfide protein 2
MKTVQVFGPGCARCKQTEQLVRIALKELGLEAGVEVVKVSDYQAMAAAGVMATPAVAIDGVIKTSGRIPALAEIKGWLKE